jgi:hypothetical protein
MKLLLYIILFTTLIGCNPEPEGGSIKTFNGDYVIKVIDSCEYIEYDYGILDNRVYGITHKGNCKFCLERIKKDKVD